MAEVQPQPDPQPSPTDMLPWEDKWKYRKIFRDQASTSYMLLSLGMGILALLLPVLLVWAAGYEGHNSISSFYHAKTPLGRDIMVGTLCAIGVFLFLFHGLSETENWLLNLGGASSIVVALVPMSVDQCHTDKFTVHGGAAMLFFTCLAIVAVFYSKGRLKTIVYPPLRRRLALAYTICGIAMIALPGIAFAIHSTTPDSCRHHGIFWAESLGVWSFSAYWFVKTYEYRKLLGIR